MPKGYGSFDHDVAHRWGYKLLVGPVPPGIHVLHTCDNPPCQNPQHWFLGTDADNKADMMAKERQARGSGNGRHVLIEEEVREIRALLAQGCEQKVIAEMYGVTQSNISRISSRSSWGWL